MSYTALYREWRPARFQNVVGQEHVTRTLRRAVEQNKISHAYLFCGPRGTGKTSVAKILARAVNCHQSVEGDPCGQCPPCQSIGSGSAVDVLEIDAASNRGIDEVRDLREKVRYAPSGLKWKTYIIDEVHMLTEPAFNALLKTLEEPPAHALFVLATTETQKIPATILSRCQRFDFHRLSVEEIRSRLQEVCRAQSVEAEEDALTRIALHAEGGLRDALSLLDQALAYGGGHRLTVALLQELLGLADEEALANLAVALLASDLTKFLQGVESLSRAGRDLRQVLRDLVLLFRDLLLAQAAGGEVEPLSAPGLTEFIQETAATASLAASQRILRHLASGEAELRRGAPVRTTFELLGVEICLGGGGNEQQPETATLRVPSGGAPFDQEVRKKTAPKATSTEEVDARTSPAASTQEKSDTETAAPTANENDELRSSPTPVRTSPSTANPMSPPPDDVTATRAETGATRSGLVHLWPEVQRVLSRNSMVLSALFMHLAEVVDEDDTLVLRLRGTRELAARFEERDTRKAIEQELRARAGRPVSFRAEAIGNGTKAQTASAKESSAGKGSLTSTSKQEPSPPMRAVSGDLPQSGDLPPGGTPPMDVGEEVMQIFGGRWLDHNEPWEDEQQR